MLSSTVYAQDGDPVSTEPQTQEDRYGKCMNLASSKPSEALNLALIWKEEGSSAPARHCEAVSLFNLAEYGEAGARFELIADDIRIGRGMPVVNGNKQSADPTMLSSMLSQAAQAWLFAGELDRAHDAASRALSIVPKGSDVHIEILLDRAQIAAADEDYDLAIEDIEAALVFDPGNVIALMYHAASKRALGYMAEAQTSINQAFKINPNNPTILLERSNIYFMMGDKESARKDLLTILRDFPDSRAAPSARINLERMALKEID